MRGCYLRRRNSDSTGGCRGGIGDRYRDSQEYELEIGSTANCSAKMMAFAAHIDEVEEYLQLLDGTGHHEIAGVILKSIANLEARLTEECFNNVSDNTEPKE